MNQEKSTHLHSPTRHFSVLLSPTPRSARLARLLATEWLRTWDLPHGITETAEHLVAELAANAATHGRLPGRDFRLALHATTDVLRIEVTDTRGDDLPCRQPPSTEAVSGRGLLLVEALADRWGVAHGPVPRKTVWAELRLQEPEHDEPCSGATGGLF
ncbi:ATP-binding protein [Streptomyces mirabilis]|uniref:ATP-binding protein n=1 Tax=Streptomyces mirabilis TaxID=68239 RepID=UPI0036CA3BDB